jgi:hypothetical protein
MTKLLGLFAVVLALPGTALAQANNGRQHERGQRSSSSERVETRGHDRGNGGAAHDQRPQTRQNNRDRVQYRDRSDYRPAPRNDARNDARWNRGNGHDQPVYRNDRDHRDDRDVRDNRGYYGSFNDRNYRVYRSAPSYRVGYGWHGGGFRPDFIGPRHVWRLEGGGGGQFFFRGFYFQIAAYDYPYASGWYWDRDNIIIYDDPDNAGCYLAFNTRLGTTVHVTYIGN